MVGAHNIHDDIPLITAARGRKILEKKKNCSHFSATTTVNETKIRLITAASSAQEGT